MTQLNQSISRWQTVLIGFLTAPVLLINAQLFQPPQQIKHHSTIIFPIQFPHYIMFHQQHANNAKNLETLNSKKILSSNDDLMVNAEKPVDTVHTMHRIEQLQQKQEPANYIDLNAKNKNAFFDEDGNKMRPHGQQGNVLTRQFTDNCRNALVLEKRRTPKTMIPISGNNKNVAKPISFAERLISNLAANNVAVNFSQSASPTIHLPFNPDGTQYSLDERTNSIQKNFRSIISDRPQLIIINGPTRIYGAGTESKFPPFLEFFVQRIQKYFSVYKYEDLSRPLLPSQIEYGVDEIENTENPAMTMVTEPEYGNEILTTNRSRHNNK